MSFFDFLFGRNKREERPRAPREAETLPPRPSQIPRQSAPGTQITYSADLIPQLKADHQQLLELFGAIKQAFAGRDLPAIARFLDEFRSKIQAHLLTENIRFYIYLEHSLAQDMESSALVHSFRQEMDTIGRAVLGFLNKYGDIGTRPDMAIPFGNDLEAVGKVLVDRIRREEETLYPLYFRGY